VVNDPQGVRVVALVPGGAAERAGRIEIGDVIEEVNAVKTADPATFVAAVQSAGALKTVTIRLRRHGRPVTISQPLGATAVLDRQ
jgi:S1-C subfamily serine protease